MYKSWIGNRSFLPQLIVKCPSTQPFHGQRRPGRLPFTPIHLSILDSFSWTRPCSNLTIHHPIIHHPIMNMQRSVWGLEWDTESSKRSYGFKLNVTWRHGQKPLLMVLIPLHYLPKKPLLVRINFLSSESRLVILSPLCPFFANHLLLIPFSLYQWIIWGHLDHSSPSWIYTSWH